jgi:predicted DCC family thiol-disulfide oxidoreductase YuxK
VRTVEKPLLIYDADCAFCRRWVARWQARTGDRIAYAPLQQPGLLQRLGVPLSAALRAVQLVTAGGARYEGAEAVFRALGSAPGLRLVTRLARLPIARWVAAWVYRRIARHRGLAARVDAVLFGRSASPPAATLVRRLFTCALGGVYLIAFTSLRRQVKGLYGAHGILPIRGYLDAVRTVIPERARARAVPTIFWLGASDEALVRACTAGQIGAGLVMLEIAPRLSLAALWGLYLSFVSVGGDFLSFQWDALLLETGLAAVIVAPPGRGRLREAPPWTAVALMRGLVFRLYFESGLCKLASGDPTWRNGTACVHHYATQPLPTRLGWYAHQLPRRVQQLSTFGALALELGMPFLTFAPRRVRRVAFVALAGLQGLIAATGNYGFFNLLTVVDSLWLLDDEAITRVLRRRAPPGTRAPWWRRFAVAVAALPLAALAGAELRRRVRRRARIPQALVRLQDALAPLRPVSSYGLFAMMTTSRPEIILEGSMDGVTWREYELPYKPGDVRTAPRWAAPHQPRLDWQMWFAALQAPPVWFARLLIRLLEGEPDVLALFAGNPFPGRPPTYVRALLYEYRMTDRQTRRRTGAWWRRELIGVYVPPVRLARPAALPA